VAIEYPTGTDTFNEPSLPEFTSLSSAGSATRNHVQHHHDLGQAIVELETYAARREHDHSGDSTDPLKGSKLLQANTHQSADTDLAVGSLHHTIDPTGASPVKAAAANHIHDYRGSTITHKPWEICTSSSRPSSPDLGTMIYETDTSRVRIWAAFPGQSNPIWQLTSMGTIPVLRAESRAEVEVITLQRHTCWFTHVLEDLFGIFGEVHHSRQVTRVIGNITDIVIPESGHYWVHARFHWSPDRCYHDHSMIEMTVNGLDVGRKDWEFVRGYSYVPGFGQSLNLNMMQYFDAGDVLRVHVKHNGHQNSWLWWHDDSPDKQYSYLDLYFAGP
jgi:hypothetical protein